MFLNSQGFFYAWDHFNWNIFFFNTCKFLLIVMFQNKHYKAYSTINKFIYLTKMKLVILKSSLYNCLLFLMYLFPTQNTC